MAKKKVRPVYGVRLMTTNTRNGNPRRSWIVFDHEGWRIDCIDEGFEGPCVFADKYPGGIPLIHVRVAPKAYREACSARTRMMA
jgi:hypothetical protein